MTTLLDFTCLRARTASSHIHHQFHLLIDRTFFAGQLLRVINVVVFTFVENITFIVARILKGQKFHKCLTIADPTSLVVTRLKSSPKIFQYITF